MDVGGTVVAGAPVGVTAGTSPSAVTGAVPCATSVASSVGVGSATDSKTVPLPVALEEGRAAR